MNPGIFAEEEREVGTNLVFAREAARDDGTNLGTFVWEVPEGDCARISFDVHDALVDDNSVDECCLLATAGGSDEVLEPRCHVLLEDVSVGQGAEE
jgi:hypothetical protein